MATVLQTTLETVADYISDCRTLLQDVIPPFRYDDPSLIVSFNLAIHMARRLRPDLFVYTYGARVPSFGPKVDTTPVEMEEAFRPAFVYGTCSHALARDQEDIQDKRASSFMGVFEAMLLGLKVTPIEGATPEGAKK